MLCGMVTKLYACPHCQRAEAVVRFGFTQSGSQRLGCKECRKTWSPDAKSRTWSAEKEALIVKARGERLSQRAIARAWSTGRDRGRGVLKKVCRVALEFSRHAVAGHFR
jgi:transposase-like protein